MIICQNSIVTVNGQSADHQLQDPAQVFSRLITSAKEVMFLPVFVCLSVCVLAT